MHARMHAHTHTRMHARTHTHIGIPVVRIYIILLNSCIVYCNVSLSLDIKVCVHLHYYLILPILVICFNSTNDTVLLHYCTRVCITH